MRTTHDPTETRPVEPVDEKLPWHSMMLYGFQHVLVMAAAPITAVFLVGQAMGFGSDVTVALMSATFLACGLGTLLQSFGPFGIGARLPFVQVPGGAPIVIFLAIAQATDIQTATGAVILTGLFYFLALPFFTKVLKFFPPIVIGTMLLLVAVNLVRIFGGLITGKPDSPDFANLTSIALALLTMGCIVLFARIFTGVLQRIAVMLGLVAGAAVATLLGVMSFDNVLAGPVVAFPSLFPFGMPKFDLFASLPLIIFSVVSMTEATGQTMATAEIVEKQGDSRALVPRNIRADALGSLIGGCFGTSLIITSGENIGIVRATGVRSRYVTVAAGIILVALALLAPLGRVAATLPTAVVAGTAVIVFAIIGVMGINILRKVDFNEHGNMFTLAAALAMGLLPIVVPGFYSAFPQHLQIILGNGLAMGTLTAVLVNILFHHLGHARLPAPATKQADLASEHIKSK
ncbi:uracil-xanthine permease [Halomonas sp. MCCC 1A17488]|uniref:Uracil-xanthine permease n=1 Tax=Billgrantia sulfidoxydans TaxID=2733484 RepID=A0ABX7WCD1_9GAMM|nr:MULTISPECIES: uracil-xanthine permease family protein [Halomonas]MCE8018340.1 uracil-xanthine permease [Halomonas sp. MCCC 1A17488]MCG3241673.1 uracil-xanthine permease [Halomonas sp. MCCC 1A17488]QPP49296.1 uracil-xanthine permease [Halomonas sp. SS10-MC5]QTP56654.1 uracil-xanthine permease [Halomonas sulfidoxydans]